MYSLIIPFLESLFKRNFNFGLAFFDVDPGADISRDTVQSGISLEVFDLPNQRMQVAICRAQNGLEATGVSAKRALDCRDRREQHAALYDGGGGDGKIILNSVRGQTLS